MKPMTAVFLLFSLALSVASTREARADFSVKGVGSFYIGGKQVTVSGKPPTEISTSPGMKPFPYDPNGGAGTQFLNLRGGLKAC